MLALTTLTDRYTGQRLQSNQQVDALLGRSENVFQIVLKPDKKELTWRLELDIIAELPEKQA